MNEPELPPDFEESVEVVAYDPAWPHLFMREAAALRALFGDRVIAIEHFGSTAVPGLAAKPVVDILVGVAELVAGRSEIAAMARLGYEHMGAGAVPGRIHFRKRQGPDGSFNTNLAVHGSALWRDNLLVRDYLRRHPDVARRYEATKRAAAAAHPDSLIQYSEAKAAIVAEIVERTRAEAGYPPG
jgi:GrpB-like predicted nucleotidyltransferase (UPF0157 family)